MWRSCLDAKNPKGNLVPHCRFTLGAGPAKIIRATSDCSYYAVYWEHTAAKDHVELARRQFQLPQLNSEVNYSKRDYAPFPQVVEHCIYRMKRKGLGVHCINRRRDFEGTNNRSHLHRTILRQQGFDLDLLQSVCCNVIKKI